MPDYPIGYEPIGTVALLTNPRSGYDSARHATERAMARFAKRGVEAVAFNSMAEEDNARIVRQAINDLDFDALVIVGGDGIINNVLQEVAMTGLPIGIIPAGSGNDTARHFGIPLNPEAAAEVIADGFVTTTDLGRVTDDLGDTKWFGTLLGCAIDAYGSARAAQMRLIRGPAKFTAAFLAEMANPHWHRYRFELEGARPIPFAGVAADARRIARDGEIPDDGNMVIERVVALACFGNTTQYAGGRVVCPDADHHDGLLDLTIVERVNRLQYAKYFDDYSSGNHKDVPFVTSYRCKRARVICEDLQVPACGDGEQLINAPFTVEAVEAAGRYIVPAP